MTPEPAATQRPGYRAYLLRLWEVETDEPVWRASLQDSHTGERLGFAGLEQLNEFLQKLTDDGNRTQKDTDTP